MMKTVTVALAMTMLGLASAGSARADDFNKQTILTFSQPFEIPGTAFPAGIYMFRLADTLADRHIVQVFNQDGTKLLATVMTIPDYRLRTTKDTVIRFNEVPRGAPSAIRAWFYPGESLGQEFVYPRQRAQQLAAATKVVVPALATDVTNVDALKTASIIAITPDAKETPVTAAIQTTPGDNVANVQRVPDNSSSVAGTTAVQQTAQNSRQLPKTASFLPLIALLGLASISLAFGLIVFGKYAIAPTP